MRKMIAAMVVMVVALMMSVPATAAGPPTIVKFPKSTIDLGNLNDGPAGDVCPFPVGVVVKGGPGHAIFFDGQGSGSPGWGSVRSSSRSRTWTRAERQGQQLRVRHPQ